MGCNETQPEIFLDMPQIRHGELGHQICNEVSDQILVASGYKDVVHLKNEDQEMAASVRIVKIIVCITLM